MINSSPQGKRKKLRSQRSCGSCWSLQTLCCAIIGNGQKRRLDQDGYSADLVLPNRLPGNAWPPRPTPAAPMKLQHALGRYCRLAVPGASTAGFGTILTQDAWLSVLRTPGTRPCCEGRLTVARAGGVFDDAAWIADEKIRARLKILLAGFSAFAGQKPTDRPARRCAVPAASTDQNRRYLAQGNAARFQATLGGGEPLDHRRHASKRCGFAKGGACRQPRSGDSWNVR